MIHRLLILLALLTTPTPEPYPPPDKAVCYNERGEPYYRHPLPSLTWPYEELPCQAQAPTPLPTPPPVEDWPVRVVFDWIMR